MIVFGDRRRTLHTVAALTELRRLAASLKKGSTAVLGCAPPGACSRNAQPRAAVLHIPHTESDQLARDRLLIESGQLAQGLLDAEFEAAGADAWGPLHHALARFTLAAARIHAGLDAALPTLPVERLPGQITVTEPEGYALYGVDPQQYAAAAAPLAGKVGLVIGLRSIGTGLAAVVAVAVDSPMLPVTLRPVGPPFDRRIRITEGLRKEFRGAIAGGFDVAVVDEGPGLSGSSFGAAADLLESLGLPPHRLRFFPSHPGNPGPRAPERHRLRWRSAQRHPAEFAPLLERGGAFAEFTRCENLSAGAWRDTWWDPGDPARPLACPSREQRKYCFHAADGTRWLAKFAGLGAGGERKAGLARRLSGAGFTPEFGGLRRGFMLWRWRDDCRPAHGITLDRERVVERLAEYLAARWRIGDLGEEAGGAGAAELLDMAASNTGEALGDRVAEQLRERWGGEIENLQRRRRPIFTDNRMHPVEWLVTPGGELIKTDAVDHAVGHDCIGPQDLMWDVAGAEVEWELDGAEVARLTAGIERRCGWRGDAASAAFHRACYLAFSLGWSTMHAEVEAAEAGRLRRRAARDARRLAVEIASVP